MPDDAIIRALRSTDLLGGNDAIMRAVSNLSQATGVPAGTIPAGTGDYGPPEAIMRSAGGQSPYDFSDVIFNSGFQNAPLAGTLRALPKPTDSLSNVLKKSQESNAMIARANEDQQKNPPEIVMRHDPMTKQTNVDITNLPHEDFQQVMEALQFTRRAMSTYDSELTRLQKLEQAQSTGFGPIANALAHFGANLAIADPRLPPVVRALGMTSKELNPTLEETRDRELAVASGLAGIAEKQQAITAGAFSRQQALAMQEAEHERKVAADQEKADAKLQDQKRQVMSTILLRANHAIDKSGNPMNEGALRGMIRSFSTDRIPLTKEDEDAIVAEHIATADQVKKGFEEKQGRDLEMAQGKAEIARETYRQNQAVSMANWYAKAHTMDEYKSHQREEASFIRQDESMRIVPRQDLTQLQGAYQTDKYLDAIERAMKDPSADNLQGLFGAAGEKIPVWAKNPDRIAREALLIHEIPRLLGFIQGNAQGGVSILRTEAGSKLIKQMGVTPGMPKEGAVRVVGLLRDLIREKRQGVINAYGGASWGVYSNLFGRDADLVKDYPGFKGIGAPGGPGPTAAPAAGGQFTPTVTPTAAPAGGWGSRFSAYMEKKNANQ